ncbi:TOBE domain-containing protein [Roseateles sp. GG27B]
MVTRPRLVLLDEPLGALDANLRARMRSELHNIRERLGVTFLHVTGSESEALAMGDRVIVLDRGRVSQFDVPNVIYSRPANPDVARFLNCYNLFTGIRGENDFACAQALFPVPPTAVQVLNSHGVHSQQTSQTPRKSHPAYAIRQDLIRFSPPDAEVPEAHASLLAKFVTSEYSGSTIRYFFEAEAGQIVEIDNHLSHQKPAELEPGRVYRLLWTASDAVVFA